MDTRYSYPPNFYTKVFEALLHESSFEECEALKICSTTALCQKARPLLLRINQLFKLEMRHKLQWPQF